MTLTVGRVSIDYPAQVRRERTKLSLSGDQVGDSTNGWTAAQVLDLRDDLAALEGALVPVTWSVDDRVDGFYRVDQVQAELREHLGTTVVVDWSMELVRLGSSSEIQFESRLVGADRANDHTVTGEVTHAAPRGHHSYETGSTEPTTVSRTGSAGTITVYRNVPRDPTWSAAPASHYAGDARAVRPSDSRVYQGTEHSLDPADWRLENELVRVAPNATNPGRLDVSHYDGGWVTKTWQLLVAAAGLDTAWSEAVLLRSGPEETVLRLARPAASGVGRVLLDLGLRRGSYLVTGLLSVHASADLKVVLATGEAATSGTGHVRATSNDANGNRAVVGSAKTFTADTVNTGLTKTAATWLDLFLSLEVGGSLAQSGDTAANLTAQYVGSRAVEDRVVRR